MEGALDRTEPSSFAEPARWPEWKPFTRGRFALTYDPNATESTETETTEKTPTVPSPGRGL
jgi:hypothetical protein